MNIYPNATSYLWQKQCPVVLFYVLCHTQLFTLTVVFFCHTDIPLSLVSLLHFLGVLVLVTSISRSCPLNIMNTPTGPPIPIFNTYKTQPCLPTQLLCLLDSEDEGIMMLQNICNHSFIDTNLIHNFLYKLHKIKFLYMFLASSAHLQEVNDVNCTCMQPLVFSFSAGGRLVHLLRGVSP